VANFILITLMFFAVIGAVRHPGQSAVRYQLNELTIADAVTLLAANRNSVKLHLRQLVQQGYLEQHGTGKGTWYSVVR